MTNHGRCPCRQLAEVAQPRMIGGSLTTRLVKSAFPIALGLFLVSCGSSSDHDPQAAGRETPTPPRPAGHERIVALLEDVARRALDEHPYFRDREARELRAKWERLPQDAPPRRVWDLSVSLGMRELWLGRVPEAIEHLRRGYALLSEINVKKSESERTVFYLGVAYLRLGEVVNGSLRHSPDSCIMPLQNGALHTDTEGSRAAIEYFSELVNRDSKTRLAATARWLLNVAYMTLGEYPHNVPPQHLIPIEGILEPKEEFPRFTNIAARLGLDIFDLAGGAIVDDFDRDGDLDLVLSTWDTSGPMHYFRNNGDGSFTDRTRDAGLTDLYGGLNMRHADYDNDGDLDILVLRGAWALEAGRHPNSLLRNQGSGTFTDVTFEAGLGDVHYPTATGEWADYDNDGDIDLYIGNETAGGFRAPCQLFRNDGDGAFADVAGEAGVQNYGFTKGVTWGDYDGDRFPDLYVSNMGQPNRLYRNNGDGSFTDRAPALGVTEPNKSFPAWFWDFDNDGALDLFVSGCPDFAQVAAHYMGQKLERGLPKLYRGDGRGGFEDVTAEQNLAYPMVTMGSNFGDLNNDGFLDFYLGTGTAAYESQIPNLMFLNRQGRSFEDITMAGGFGHLQKGHVVSFADLDHDGDLDVYQQMGGAFPGDKFNNALYENPGFGNHWITIELAGTRSNRAAVGARIRLQIEEDGRARSIYRHINNGSSFGSNPFRQTIGLGQADFVRELEVYWPASDSRQLFESLPAGRAYRITEGEDEYETLDLPRMVLGVRP